MIPVMAPTIAQTAGQKRKAVSNVPASPAARKRQKTQIARIVPAQSTEEALSATGELDVAAFVKAREYEINALERSMQKSRKGLNTRAFQQVPRVMRRRTASHNVKKVPRRLRRRAEREMKEDNTPTVTSRRRTPSAKMRLRRDTVARLKILNAHTRTIRSEKKQAKLNAAQTDPQVHTFVSRMPKIKKNNLSEPPKAISKFRKRQVHKTWLPTHMWHAKRAHMTKPSRSLWRMSIPESPTEKSYRPSHRASGGRGCVAWDMSYMSTIGCEGIEASLDGMLKSVGFHSEGWSGAKHKKWKRGTRSAEGWVFEAIEDRRAIAPVVVVWCVEDERKNDSTNAARILDEKRHGQDMSNPVAPIKTPMPKKTKVTSRRLLIRIHPSAFHQLWVILLEVARQQRPTVTVEDLRFELGSIEVIGPGSTEALLGVLKPTISFDKSNESSSKIWESLVGLTNPASLPQGCLLGFNICDPRMNHLPKQVQIPTDEASATALTELLVSWPPDTAQQAANIFSHKCRRLASMSLPSQKAVNRRKALAPPGESPASKETDPRIPVLLLASRPLVRSNGAQGSWTVLLPWKCVDPVWRSLIYYPLSSGGTPRFGGLEEKQQICFERDEAWYPGDMPGTDSGLAWERTQSEMRYDEWNRRPPSRRVDWNSLDLGAKMKGEHGRGWICDWEFLYTGKVPEAKREMKDGAQDETAGSKTDVKALGKTTIDARRQKLSKDATGKMEGVRKNSRNVDAKDEVKSGKGGVTVEGYSKSRSAKSPRAPAPPPPPESGLTPLLPPLFTHIVPSLAAKLFKHASTSTTLPVPALATIRITLLNRGTPKPCARIYGLPSPSTPAGSELREQWLAHDPSNRAGARRSRGGAEIVNCRFLKEKINHRGDLSNHAVYPLESPDGIDYELPDNKHLAAPPSGDATAAPAKSRPKIKSGPPLNENLPAAPQETKQEDHRARLMAQPMTRHSAAATGTINNPNPNSSCDSRLQHHHPPCLPAEYLIGFVTSGSYNLAEGRGTAIGSIWVQHVISRWNEDQNQGRVSTGAVEEEAGGGKLKKQERGSGKNMTKTKQDDRQRRLCVVRNVGEEVGRLAVWDVCG